MNALATTLPAAGGQGRLPAAPGKARGRRKILVGTLSVLIVAGVFGLALPRISSYGQEWHTVAAMTWQGIALVAIATAASLAATWVMIRAFLPRLRLHQAAAVSLSSSAVANTVPAGGTVALGLSWRMMTSWGVGTQDFVQYTLVSGLWNAFARLSLPVIALSALVVSGKSGGVPPAAAYCGAGALVVIAAGLRVLLRSTSCAARAGQALQSLEALGCRIARRQPSQRMASGLLRFRAGTSAMLADRWIRITVTTMLANIAFWLVLLACLRASGLTQAQVSWQASLAAFALVRLMTVLPLTPGGLGIVELGLTAPLIAGLGSGASARVAAAVLLYRALTYLPSLPLGALAYVWWRHGSQAAGVRSGGARRNKADGAAHARPAASDQPGNTLAGAGR
ncbi:MAG TPA: lysylphosphatidylglycerol synthase domain-containing protein [Streptosporangiaceae bacterium]